MPMVVRLDNSNHAARPAWRCWRVLTWVGAVGLLLLSACRHEPASEPLPEPPVAQEAPIDEAPEPPPPPSDGDHDGRVGEADRCPDQAETYEGTDDDDGCPDAPSLVRTSADGRSIELLEQPRWTNLEVGRLAPEQPTLEHLCALLRAWPELEIEVRAHEPPREQVYGRDPTRTQAEAIADWLISHGIEARRIRSVGYGDSMPIVPNDSDEHRAINQRIEVVVPAAD